MTSTYTKKIRDGKGAFPCPFSLPLCGLGIYCTGFHGAIN